LHTIEQIEAGHPIPDEAGREGTRKILDMLADVDVRTLVICLLSGGGSALLVDPLPGISLEDKQKTTDLLQRVGASVYELNTVLKHLSGVKGGRLARAAYPASILTLTLSDVIGDRIDVIASGPMAPGNSTFCEAARVIEKFKLRYRLPEQVVAFIERGTRGQEPETANSRESCFFRTRNVIVGGMAQALFSAGRKAMESGYVADLMISEDRGPVRRLAHVLAKKALRIRDDLFPGESRCLFFCGESAAAGRGNGRSSRSQELALAFAQEIAGIPGITLLSAGTDEAAEAVGVVVDGTTSRQARKLGLQPQSYLDNDDPAAFFDKLGCSHGAARRRAPGPTGINVLDVQVLFLEG
jgi:glycerate-2-kinase